HGRLGGNPVATHRTGARAHALGIRSWVRARAGPAGSSGGPRARSWVRARSLVRARVRVRGLRARARGLRARTRPAGSGGGPARSGAGPAGSSAGPAGSGGGPAGLGCGPRRDALRDSVRGARFGVWAPDAGILGGIRLEWSGKNLRIQRE